MHSSHITRDYVAPRHASRRQENARRQRQIAAGILAVGGVSIPGVSNVGLDLPGVAPAPIAETPLPLPGASIPDTTKPVIEKPANKPAKKKPEQVAKPMGENDETFTHGTNPGGDEGDGVGEASIPELTRTAPPENTAGDPPLAKIKVDLGNDKTAEVDSTGAGAIEAKIKNVGKRVSWTAFGKDNTGTIFCVVPIGMTPTDLSIGSGKSKAKPRDALSYVVEVEGGGHAWPETKALTIVKD